LARGCIIGQNRGLIDAPEKCNVILSNLLRGEKVYLSPLTKEDSALMARWELNSEYMRLADSDPAVPHTAEVIAEGVDEFKKKTNAYRFGIRLVENDALIGDEMLAQIEWQHGVSWLGIAIGDPAYWGKGYGTEATALLLRFGFWEINLHRIQLTVFEYNERAIAAYEKLGFVKEGTYRQFLQRDGKRYDMYLYGLLRPEWEARNGQPAGR
jgi:RimJ/RimL family protein N-acetyltransferase